MVKIIDGKAISQEIRDELKEKVRKLKEETGIIPGLAVILVGDNPASKSYVTAKERALEQVGMTSVDIRLPETTTQDELVSCIKSLNENTDVHGILVQLPLPKHIDENVIIDTISPKKDVDGFTAINVGNMLIGKKCFLPCTPYGIIQLLKYSNIDTCGKHVVVVGRSNIVGKPIANLLASKEYGNATVTICHTKTFNLTEHTRQADILIVASGRPNTINGSMVKYGAVVIDVGVNRIPSTETKSGYKLVGDCDFESVSEVASLITPVPGGVGPMTITSLLENVYLAASK